LITLDISFIYCSILEAFCAKPAATANRARKELARDSIFSQPEDLNGHAGKLFEVDDHVFGTKTVEGPKALAAGTRMATVQAY